MNELTMDKLVRRVDRLERQNQRGWAAVWSEGTRLTFSQQGKCRSDMIPE